MNSSIEIVEIFKFTSDFLDEPIYYKTFRGALGKNKESDYVQIKPGVWQGKWSSTKDNKIEAISALKVEENYFPSQFIFP